MAGAQADEGVSDDVREVREVVIVECVRYVQHHPFPGVIFVVVQRQEVAVEFPSHGIVVFELSVKLFDARVYAVMNIASEHRLQAHALDGSDDVAGGMGKKRNPLDWTRKCDMQCVCTVKWLRWYATEGYGMQ